MRKIRLRRYRRTQEEKHLLKQLGFTYGKALRWMLFSMCFSAIGLCAFGLCALYSFNCAKEDLSGRINQSLLNIYNLYSVSTELDEAVISEQKLHFGRLKNIGAEDLNINKKAPLKQVRAQRRVISENLSLIRFIDKD